MFQFKTVDQFSGVEGEPVGEEKRVAAGLNSLGGRSPGNLVQYLWTPHKVLGAPRGYDDYDVVVPFLFASFGGTWSGRQSALLGHAVFHITGTGAVENDPRYVEYDAGLDEGYVQPTLLVRGADGQWHAYRGQVVTNMASRMVQSEYARRALVGDEQYEDGLFTAFAQMAEGICQLDGWEAWREAKDVILGKQTVSAE